jgi:DNA mismatch endonuclease (patch repair protein)
MTDTISTEMRSRVMAKVRSKDTQPEMRVRRLIHAAGYRYRLHCRDLPGKPDLVFRSRRKVVFVHGCFWHRHPGCAHARIPKSRVEFWIAKLEGNRTRDHAIQQTLIDRGWGVLVIWECELACPEAVLEAVVTFLDA